jgi:hypothetical protein
MMSRIVALMMVVFLVSACSAGDIPAHAAGHRKPPPAAPPAQDMPGIIKASVAGSGPAPGLTYVAPGTPVSAADIGTRTAGTGQVIYGLADQGAYLGSVWPVISSDAGRHWRIDGPLFFYAAADGPAATDSIGAHGAGMAWAWGHGGNFVKVTTDGGRHWWFADFPTGVVNVSWQAGHLTAVAFWTGPRVFRYISPDNGRTWRLQRSQDALRSGDHLQAVSRSVCGAGTGQARPRHNQDGKGLLKPEPTHLQS